jgi:hypothetical protein
MAWRIADLVVEGEIDNTVKGRVIGWIRLSDRAESVKLDLQGDCHPDLAGWRFRVRRLRDVPAWAEPVDASGLTNEQVGDVGDITADQVLRDFDCSVEEFLMRKRAGEPVPEQLRKALYLEWYSHSNGRVVIQDTRLGIALMGQRGFELTEEDLRRKREKAEQELDELRQQGFVIEEDELGVMIYRRDGMDGDSVADDLQTYLDQQTRDLDRAARESLEDDDLDEMADRS